MKRSNSIVCTAAVMLILGTAVSRSRSTAPDVRCLLIL